MSAPTPVRARQRAKRKRNERGIALVMVLGAIAVLTVMLAEFQEETSAELASALADRDLVQGEYFAKSAVNLARLLIASEPTIRTAIAPLFMLMKRTPPQIPVWEFSDRVLGAFNDEDTTRQFALNSGLDMSLAKNVGLKGGRWELKIIDEDAKINVNLGASNDIAHLRLAKQMMSTMSPIQYNPLFEQRDAKGNVNDRLTVCSSIIDWADVDENRYSCDLSTNAPSGNSVEDYSYYTYLPKPYRMKNSPFDSLEELHVVRGVTDDFWSTFVDPDPTNPRKRVFTVWGQGLINVNSANGLTLWSIVCSGAPTAQLCTDPLQMQTFVMGVTMASGITMGAPLFGSPADFINMMKGKGMLGPLLTAMGMKPVTFQSESDFAKSISTESKMFSIYAVGVIKGSGGKETRTSIHTVVDFRSSPALVPGVTGSPSPTSSSAAAPPTAPTSTSGSSSGNSLASAAAPNAGGQVIYYQIE